MKMFNLSMPVLSLLILLSAACAHKTEAPPPKTNLVLISGSHLDETSWNLVTKNIDAVKYNVLALPRLGRNPDLPSHMKEIAKLSCDKIPENSIIVAHSFGGAFVNEMFGVCPKKIIKVIYVAALIPLKNEHATDILKNVKQKTYSKAVTIDKKGIYPKSQTGLLCALDAGIDHDAQNLPPVFPEPLLPGSDLIEYDLGGFDKLPKFYIYTDKDQIIPLAIQKKITQRVELKSSETLPSGHLPMLTHAEELANLIVKFAVWN